MPTPLAVRALVKPARGFATRGAPRIHAPARRGLLGGLLTASLVVGLLVSIPAIAASPAAASPSGGVLILATSVNGGMSSLEALAAAADGYAVTIESASAWESLTTPQFENYNAIVLGDPSTASSCASSPSTSLSAATGSYQTTWSSAVSGNVLVAGAAPAFAAEGNSNVPGANAFLEAAIKYAAEGNTTGLYVSLDCYYSTASSGTAVSFLSDIDGGGFAVQGDGGGSCSNSGTLNVPVLDYAGIQDLDNLDLASWPCAVQESFTSYPSATAPLAIDRGVSSSFTTADGMSGQPYILVSNPSVPTYIAPGGAIEGNASYGLSNDDAPGLTPPVTANGVNTETGDYSSSYSDLSIPTYGPALGFTRSYDAKLAQQESISATPGPLGYGWEDTDQPFLSYGSLPGAFYTLDGNRTDTLNGTGLRSTQIYYPQAEYFSGGNLYIADTDDNRVLEVPGASGTQWGISMVGGDVYTIAGNLDGVAGDNGSSTTPVLNTSSYLNAPTGLYMDSSGNLYIADANNCRVVELAGSSWNTWGNAGISVQANDVFTVVGEPGTCGWTGNNTRDTSTLLKQPTGVVVENGNLVIDDSGNNRVIEVYGNTSYPTVLGVTMTTQYDTYAVAGNVLGCSANGKAAVGNGLDLPTSITFDGSKNLMIADSANNRVMEVPNANGTFWGISMTAGKIYDIVGNVSCTAGHTGDNGVGTSSYLSGPNFVDFQSNNLYISDTNNNRIQEMPWSSQTQWNISMTKNDVYTIAGNANGAGGYAGDGTLAYGSSVRLDEPGGLWVDNNANLDISDSLNNVIRQVSSSSPWYISTYIGTGGGLQTGGNQAPATGAALSYPGQVAIDSAGNVYIADTLNNRIQEIAATNHTQFGIPMTAGYDYTIAGLANGVGGNSTDTGPATSSALDQPYGVAVDAAGDLFIADTGSCRVREVPAISGTYFGRAMTDGDIYTIAGVNGTCGSTGNGGIGTSAELYDPKGITLDAAGDVVVADYYSNEVQRRRGKPTHPVGCDHEQHGLHLRRGRNGHCRYRWQLGPGHLR